MHWLDPDYLPETAGKVAQFLINPHGEIDGLLLDDGTEIHTPPHLSDKIAKAVALGEKIKIRGVRPRGVPMITAVAIETVKGVRIVDDGPPDDHKHAKHKHKEKAKDLAKPADASGVVRHALHGPKGEVRGVLLEDGTAIRFPKHAAENLKPLTKAGAKCAAHGHLTTSGYGSVLDAREIGSSSKTMKPFGSKPGRPHSKHKHPAELH